MVGVANLSHAVVNTQDAQSLSVEEKKDLATATIRGLSDEDRAEVVGDVLRTPNRKVTDQIWLAIVVSLILVLLVSLGAVVFFVYEGMVGADVVPAVLTAVLGYLVGLIHPSPVAGRQDS